MVINPAAIRMSVQSGQDGIFREEGTWIEPVLLIHGTFANKRSDEGRIDWWHPNSDFCLELDTLLAQEGSPARCWAQLGQGGAQGRGATGRVRPPFAWTGANSELDRRSAGRALAAELEALENDPRVRRYHLIGHSHGGNVILHALRAMSNIPAKLGAVVFMGTPVLSFRHREELDVRWLALPMYVVALVGIVWAYRQWPDNEIIWGTVIVAIVLALIAELFVARPRARRPEAELYGSGYARAFVFDGDEAITSLQAAQEIARDPRRFINQFTQPGPASEPAYRPTQVVRPVFAGLMQNTGAYWLLQTLRFPSVPVTFLPGSQPFAAPHASPRSRLSGWLQSVGEFIEHVSIGFPFKFIFVAVLWLCATLPLLVMAAAGAVYSGVTWLIGGIVAAVMVGGARKLGRLALPVLVRKAALGADSGSFVEVADLPPGVVARVPISDELRAQAAEVSRRFGQDTGQVTLHAIANMDPFAIKSRVTDALTNTSLAHSYYYRATEVKEKIAHLIAVRPVALDSVLAGSWLTRLPLTDWLRDTSTSPSTATGQEMQPPSH